MAYLGIDLGTSGLRALLTDAKGVPLASSEWTYDTDHPFPGWSEQSPAVWLAALEEVVRVLRDTHPLFAEVRGIGVSGHMHGAVLLDAEGEVIRPCILWNDTRSHAEAAALDAMDAVRALSGNIVFPGFTAPKLEWLRRYEPENHARVAKVLLPAAFLNHFLTGDFVADVSDSAGTSWLDLRTRCWSDFLLRAGHMEPTQMPRLVEGCGRAGFLRDDLVRAWGLKGKVVVAGGAGDNAAAACGIGALGEGQGFVSLGTSGVLLVARDTCHPVPETALHTFCHAVPDRWYQMGVMLSATASLNWLSGISGRAPGELTGMLGDRLQRPGAELFLPYLSGERTPHNDAEIRGAFTGLSARTSLADMSRAVLEGVAFGLRNSAEALQTAGAEFTSLFAIGGGMASRYWVRLIATVLDTPLHVPEGREWGAALGAARLAICAETGTEPEKVMHPPAINETVMPNQALKDSFENAYQKFQKSYPAIRSIQ